MDYIKRARNYIGKKYENIVNLGRKLSSIGNITNKVTEALNNYPPRVKDFLDKYGQNIVSNITIRRAPIKGALNTALEFITGGMWNKLREKYGYDYFYHLSMVFNLDGVRQAVLEKNQVINLSSSFSQAGDEDIQMVNGGGMKLIDLMENTRKKMGDKAFFTYTPFGNNCQNFLLNVLSANGLLTPQLRTFIDQPIDQLVKELPSYVAPVAKGLTDIGAIGDLAIQNLKA
jgi:hypothetical protein